MFVVISPLESRNQCLFSCLKPKGRKPKVRTDNQKGNHALCWKFSRLPRASEVMALSKESTIAMLLEILKLFRN